MFGVDDSGYASGFLCFGDSVYRQSRFTARFGSVYLDYSAARITSDAKSGIEPDRARRDNANIFDIIVAELHYRAFAVVFFYFVHCQLQCFQFVRRRCIILITHTELVSYIYVFYFCKDTK